jgi:dachs protein
VTFRITPTSHSELLNGDEPVSTLTQDFHFRLDNLLRTLVHAKPHFIRCIRPNETESSAEFDRGLVMQQVRSLQVLETVNLMAGGFPHRMRFKNFNSIYWMLAPIKILSRSEELAFEDCRRILDYLKESLEQPADEGSPIARDWALGKKHVFLTEGTRQHLEKLRTDKRNASVTLIQSVWRGFAARKKWPAVRRSLQAQAAGQRSRPVQRPRPQPIAGTPPPEAGGQAAAFLLAEQSRHEQHLQDRCDMKTIQKTCSLFGLDPVSA